MQTPLFESTFGQPSRTARRSKVRLRGNFIRWPWAPCLAAGIAILAGSAARAQEEVLSKETSQPQPAPAAGQGESDR
jgi:hypothetical protein